MALIDEFKTKDFQTNTVIKIGDDYYSEKQVDSGLIIDDDKLVVDRPKINGVKLDIRKVNTPIGSSSFVLKDDDDEATTIEIMKTEGLFLEKDVIMYLGVIKDPTDPFDWSEYVEVSRTSITGVKKIANGYSITSKQITHKVNQPALNVESGLTTALLPVSTSLDIVDASIAPFTSGLIYVEGEIMSFNGISSNTLQNLVRGLSSTDANSHEVGEAVQFITEFDDLNPMTIILQILLSKNGDGVNHPTYDVLPGGLGMSPDEVDIATFEALEVGEFLDEKMDLLTFGQETILKWIEDEILSMCIARLITINGKVSITVLDQVDLSETVPTIDESQIIGTPTWSLNSDKIVNRVTIFYDFNYGTGTFESSLTVNDSDSQTTFGKIKEKKYKWKGVTSALDGASIALNRAGRILERLSTARGSVKVKAHIDTTEVPLGTNAELSHRYLPQEGGKLGMSQQLELMSQGLDLTTAINTMNMEFTSYSGLRAAFIAPSPFISNIVDQKTFDVPDGNCYREGYVLKLWDSVTRDYLPDSENVVELVEGNTITMTDPWTTTLLTSHKLKMSDYDEASTAQQARYAFIGENTGFFNDGSKSYQVLF